MTKKDYELIAKTLQFTAQRLKPQDRRVLTFVARELAIELVAHNPKFDPERFLTACGAN